MSIALIKAVLASDLPQRYRAVLLVIADAINDARPDDGAWLLVSTLMDRSAFSRRAVLQALADCEKAGLLAIEHRIGRSSVYRIVANALGARERAPRRTSAPCAPVRHAHGLVHAAQRLGEAAPTRAPNAPPAPPPVHHLHRPVHRVHQESELNREIYPDVRKNDVVTVTSAYACASVAAVDRAVDRGSEIGGPKESGTRVLPFAIARSHP